MKKLAVSVLSVMLLIGTSRIAMAESAKPGSFCAKAGVSVRVGAKQLTCVKSGKKLVWAIVQSSTQVTTPSPSMPAKSTSLRVITPVSIPTKPPVPPVGTYILNNYTFPPAKTMVRVALFGAPGPVYDKAVRTLPIALQKLADVTGNSCTILDTTGVPTPFFNDTCNKHFGDIDIVIGDGTNDARGGSDASHIAQGGHGVTSPNTGNSNIANCPGILIGRDAQWSSEDFSSSMKSVGHTIMHELGHAFGLGHPPVDGQVMQTGTVFVNDYSPGDRYGLYLKTQGLR